MSSLRVKAMSQFISVSPESSTVPDAQEVPKCLLIKVTTDNTKKQQREMP